MDRLKILLFGRHGQLGWELHRCLQGLGYVLAYDYPEIDFLAPSAFGRLITDLRPHVVINAAAYTDVDKAELEVENARIINAEAPALLAETCGRLGAAFIHFSTDYVFDGRKGSPYVEEDVANPLSAYGLGKLEGERAVLSAGGASLVLRTAWVYSTRSDSFVMKVLRWARTQETMRIVEDQVSNPTWARALAETTAHLIAKAGPDPLPWLRERSGLYHLAGKGYASRLEWAKAILSNDPKAGEHLVRSILPAESTDFSTPAARPRFSALDCSRFQRVFSLSLPEWESALRLAME